MATKKARVRTTPVVEQPKAAPQPPQPQPKAETLSKRSTTKVDQVLAVNPEKRGSSRAEHVQKAWEAVVKAAPAPASELVKLPELQDAKLVSPALFLNYMLRRKYLVAQQ